MAQIVTITNPLTGQPAQVDQLDHTAQQIDDAIARALPGGDIDTLLAEKAPSGYGLGTSAVAIDDYNNAINNGWYRGGANYPSKINYANYGMVRVDSVGQIKFQTFYAGDTGSAMTAPFMAIRKSGDYGATWSEWEYVNPPMIFGEEYRTTERYNGKPVYKRAVNIGDITGKGTSTFENKGAGTILSCEILYSGYLPFTYIHNSDLSNSWTRYASVSIVKSQIEISYFIGSSWGTSKNTVVILRYLKG